jgi:hypothetical protein
MMLAKRVVRAGVVLAMGLSPAGLGCSLLAPTDDELRGHPQPGDDAAPGADVTTLEAGRDAPPNGGPDAPGDGPHAVDGAGGAAGDGAGGATDGGAGDGGHDAASADASADAPPPPPVVTVASGQANPDSLAVDDTGLYWANAGLDGGAGSVARCDGSASCVVETLVGNLPNPASVALDSKSVYWVTFVEDGGVLARDKASPASVRELNTEQARPSSITVSGGFATYAWQGEGPTAGNLRTCDVAGCSPAFPIAQGQDYPALVAADADYVFFANVGSGGATGSVARCHQFSGCSPPQDVDVIASGMRPGGLALDATSVYWTESDTGRVMRRARDVVPDGGAPAAAIATGQSAPGAMAIDAKYAYWCDEGDGTVRSARLDGSEAPVVVASGQNGPSAIAVGGGAVYFVTQGDRSIKAIPARP